MNTQNAGPTPVDTLQERINNLKEMHQRITHEGMQLSQMIQNNQASRLKVEGAIEALADFQDFSQPQDKTAIEPGSEEGSETPEETELIN